MTWSCGDKTLGLAGIAARSIAQNVIDGVDEHRHLRSARILILYQTGQKANADGLVELGRARKASPIVQLVGERPDFLITINEDQWAGLSDVQNVALLDHQLTHCAVTICGRYVPEAMLEAFEEMLGGDHVETCTDVRDEKDRVLVRYRKRRGPIRPGQDGYEEQPYAWRIRKHDIELFSAVVHRWGAWTTAHRALVDTMDEPEEPMPLLSMAEHVEAAVKDPAVQAAAKKMGAGIEAAAS